MPQSLTNILVHIIFSTKDREPFIDEAVRPYLHGYVATLVRNTDSLCYRVGGVEDHIHLAVRISKDLKITKLMETVKSSSSRWIKTQSAQLGDFSWQRGYAAFSVGPGDREALCRYIDNQAKHHEKVTFKDEMRLFFRKYEVEYDEVYVWD